MSLLAQHGLMMGGGDANSVDPFVNVTHVIGGSGSSISAAVPAGAIAGDTLVFVVRVRGDRSASAPSGFTKILEDEIGSSGSPSGRAQIFVFTKAYTGETTVTAGHSSNAPYGATLYVVRGSVINTAIGQVASNIQEIAIAKSLPQSGLIACGLVAVGGGFATADPSQSDWTQRGTDYYDGTNYFGVGYSRAYSGTGLVQASIGSGVTLGGLGTPHCVVLLEVN